jgi:hypothetical protein
VDPGRSGIVDHHILKPVTNWCKSMAAAICRIKRMHRSVWSSAMRPSCCGLLWGSQLSSLVFWRLTLSGAAGGHAITGGGNLGGYGQHCSSLSIARRPSRAIWSRCFTNAAVATPTDTRPGPRRRRPDPRNDHASQPHAAGLSPITWLAVGRQAFSRGVIVDERKDVRRGLCRPRPYDSQELVRATIKDCRRRLVRVRRFRRSGSGRSAGS